MKNKKLHIIVSKTLGNGAKVVQGIHAYNGLVQQNCAIANVIPHCIVHKVSCYDLVKTEYDKVKTELGEHESFIFYDSDYECYTAAAFYTDRHELFEQYQLM